MIDDRANGPPPLILAGVLAVAMVAILAGAWVGFIGSDDMEYYVAGRALSQSFWNAPEGFGGMRTAVTVPIALSIKVLGDSELALVLPTCLYALATVLVGFLALSRRVAPTTALLSTLLFATLPVMAITSTMAGPDVAELFWAVCAFWLVLEAADAEGGRRGRLMFMAGACIALAFAARETAAAMILWLALGFLAGYAMPRLSYVWSGFGFLAVFLTECTYFAISAGDFLLRFRALGATRSVTSRMVVPPFTFDDTGNLRIHDLIDPLVMMLTKHSFGPIYWILIGLAVYALWRRRPLARTEGNPPGPPDPGRRVMVAGLALGLVWIVFAAFALSKIRIHARYYLAPTYFLVVAATVWWAAAELRRRTMVLLLGFQALANGLGIWLDNRNPRFAERALADMTARISEPIHTDGATARIAVVFARWQGGGPELIVGTPANEGALRFRVLSGIGSTNRQLAGEVSDKRVAEVVFERLAAPPLIGGALGEALARAPLLPASLTNKLTSSRSSGELLRVGSALP